MSTLGVNLVLPALGIMLALLSAPAVAATNYYYYYYYPNQQQSAYTCPSNYYNYGRTCHIDTCYTPQTWHQCCIQFFTYYNVAYKVCICNPETKCTHSEVVTIPTTTTTTTTTTTPATTTTTPTTPTTTTTTTTKAPTTTPVFKSLCPSSFRLLNGNPAQPCDFSGIANVTLGKTLVCNAVYTPTRVEGVKKITFVTAAECIRQINIAIGNKLQMDIQIGDIPLPVASSIFTIRDGPNGAGFIDMDPKYANTLRSLGCQKTACPLDSSAEMAAKLDYSKCKMVSWGATVSTDRNSNKLMEAEIQLSQQGCERLQANQPLLMCYKTVNNKNLLCKGDIGAPIYCQAPSNGEWILFGVASSDGCNFNPYASVARIPS